MPTVTQPIANHAAANTSAQPSAADDSGEECPLLAFFTGTKWTDVVLALFTALLAIFAGRQITWMRRTNATMESTIKAMDKTAERQLRAYVTLSFDNQRGPNIGDGTIGGIAIGHDPLTTEVTGAVLRYRNCGQTPAYDVTCDGDIYVFPFPQSKEWKNFEFDPLEVRSRFALGPQQESEVNIRRKKIPPRPMPHDSRVYIFGRIDYRDAFNTLHTTYFCLSCVKIDGILRPQVCERGNDAT
jgi:hypothetical protein